MSDAVWITWEDQIRNRSISAQLGAELYVFVSKRARLARYAICSYRSFRVIWKHRPTVVFAPNPSIVLAYLLLILRAVFRYALVIDAHYGGVVALSGNDLLQQALDFCNCRADLVIVTNEEHRKRVESVGGRALVCEDPLPDIEEHTASVSEDSKDVFVICSFDVDEPYDEIFQAARLLNQDGYVFWVSGNFRKVGIKPSDWPCLRFMGYVPEREFYDRLARSQIVVDLTKLEDCLVCGAYEAMALEKPLVTSNTVALRRYFTGGTVFVDHKPEAVAEGVRLAYERRGELRVQITGWKRQAADNNARRIGLIREFLITAGAQFRARTGLGG